MLSATTKYAIRALIYIAFNQKDSLVNIKQIAKDLNISYSFLTKIISNLTKHKILYSQRGIQGGIKFQKNPSKISILDIVEIFDGLEMYNECLIGLQICKKDIKMKEVCPFRMKLDPILEQIYKVFKELTINEIVTKLKPFDVSLLL